MTSEATIYREYSYDILPVYPCCTIGARLLHYRCKAAALSVQGCCTDGARLLSSNNPAKKTTYLIKKQLT